MAMRIIEPPERSPELDASLKRARTTFVSIKKALPQVSLGNRRHTLLAVYSSIVWQHFQAILLLCEDGTCPGSALALFRPLVEAIVRGEWLSTCAKDEQVDSFLSGQSWAFPGFKEMVSALDDRPQLQGLFNGLIDAYGNMCDYTHGGDGQVASNYTEQAIGPAYDGGMIVGLVRESEKRAVAFAFVFCCVTDPTEGANQLAELASSFAGDCSPENGK